MARPDVKAIALRAATRVAARALLVLPLAGCDRDEPKPQPAAAVTASAEPSARPAVEAVRPREERPLSFAVDEQGPFVAGARVDLSATDGLEKLDAQVAALPVRGKTLEVSAARAARTPHVAALVGALGKAGAAEVAVRTPGRAGVKDPLRLTPERVVGAGSPDCAAVAMVRKDGTTAAWRLRGGVATRGPRGFSGPDLSVAFDLVKKNIDTCAATTWYFSADDSVAWGLAVDLGAVVAMATPPTKATTTVLLARAPVAGRPVKPGSP